jgi:heat shock protein HslJ
MARRRLASLVLLALLVSGCSMTGDIGAADDGLGGELQANRWVLRSYASGGGLVIVPDDQYADAEFRSNRISGFGGCGDYDAAYRTGGRLLLVSILAYSCGDPADTFQATYVTLLGQSRWYSVGANSLIVRGPDRSTILEYDAAPPNPLLGSWVVESYAATPGTPIAPIAETVLSVVFRFHRVGGSSGCNTFQGPYTQDGNLAGIGPLATTQMACPEDVMNQETAFLKALQGIGRIEPRGQRLELTDLTGKVVVTLIRPSAIAPPPSPSPSASPSAAPTASPTPVPSPSASPSAAPTATATAAPTATPTAAPTASPTAAATPVASASAAPSVAPPASLPPLANCALGPSTIVYPASWFTLPAPSTAACRYFSPAPITAAPAPGAPITGIVITTDPAATYAEALTAATNPTAWNVLTNQAVTLSGFPATRIQATSTAGVPQFPADSTRYGYLIDVGGRGVWIQTGGTVGDAAFATRMTVVNLMASQSTIVPPIPS